nr:prephenate dehydrogenase/arogenate dehydrogenase family protein [Bosea sp. (in: a-proteobacteria)]
MAESFAPRRSEPVFARLAIIGIGLIGSSIAHAAKELNLAGTIVLADRDEAVRQRARELGLGHLVAETAVEAVRDADHVILCVPVGACGSVAAEIACGLKPGAILSDVGSVKGAVVDAVMPHLPEGVSFVPAHPVAGTENSGPDAGFSSLFLNRWCILTPPEGTDPAAIARTRQLWEGMGALVEVMSAQHHDLVLAVTSHLPHLIAYNIVGTA